MTINTQRVLLHDTLIGMLSFKQGVCEFKLVESYKRAYPRLVLGQQFLDDLEQVHLSRSGVAPPWFSNLLPEAESPLRKLLVKQAGINSNQDFFLLHYLGEDLPGAVRIIAEDDVIEPDSDEELKDEGEGQSETWSVRFSLAGMQPKFSVLRGERGFTLPVNGLGGKWIVKLPSPNFPKVPENEYATMLWAKASGISVPDLELVEVKDIAGLPTAARDFPDNLALAVRRFDRLEQNRRVHMEDFAQILGLYPHEKYSRNYETLANLILSMTGEAGLDAFIHQLVFVIISGNNDAHQKNWSLIYPNGVSAELSPAYDLVSTIQYKQEDMLALKLANSKRWEDVRLESFRQMAKNIGDEESHMVVRVQAAIDSIINSWNESGKDFGYDSEARKKLERHFRRIPILKPNFIKS